MSYLVAEDGVIAHRLAKLPGVQAQEGVAGSPRGAFRLRQDLPGRPRAAPLKGKVGNQVADSARQQQLRQ